MDRARSIWAEMYQGEPFDLDLGADWARKTLPRYTTRISHDIVSAAQKQQDFYYQVCVTRGRAGRDPVGCSQKGFSHWVTHGRFLG